MTNGVAMGDAGSTATQIGAAVTIISGLSVNEWGVLIGIALSVAGLGISWWYKHKTLKHLRGD